jgi:hypothetical protein
VQSKSFRGVTATARGLAFAACVAATALAGNTAAQSAQDQFNEGMKLMAKGDFDGACAAFEKSEDPEPTIATRYQLGKCNEERGHYGTAYLRYGDAARLADEKGDKKRAQVARQRANEVEPKAPRMVIVVPADRQVDGLTIKRGGKKVPKADWSKATVVDNGFHDIEISAPGVKTVTMRVEAKGGTVAKVAVPKLDKTGSAGDGGSAGAGGSSGAGGSNNVAPPGPSPTSSGAVPIGEPPPPPVDEGPQTKRKSSGLFWTGTGLVIAGGLAGLGGTYLVATNDNGEGEGGPPVGGISLLIGSVVFLGVGIPFMVVFGEKVPAEAETPEGKPTPTTGVILEPIVSPTYGGLRLRF